MPSICPPIFPPPKPARPASPRRGDPPVGGLARATAASIGDRFPTPLIMILGPALGGAFLISNPWIGALLWLAIFQDLPHAAFALLGIGIAEAIVRAARVSDGSPVDGSLKANAVLAALAASWLTESVDMPVEIGIVIAAISAATAAVLTAAITRALATTGLPTLVLGYCVTAMMLFATFHHWTETAVLAIHWPLVPDTLSGWIMTFFETLGALVFLPTARVGIVVALAILLWSRAAFVAGVAGWIAGVLVSLALAQIGVVYYWMPAAYNFFLAGMGLGAIFFLPGPASLLIATLGGASAAIIAVALQHLFPDSSFGYLPIASLLTIWVGIYALAQASEQTLFQRNHAIEMPPEEAWWRAAYWLQRLGPPGPFLVVPLDGRAQVSQGWDGEFSHVGPWRNALDFQRPAPTAHTTSEEPTTIWNADVSAPAAGFVERIESRVPDNPLGVANYADNWGNYVIIRLDQGGWATLAHLRQGSVAVSLGMRVEIGTRIGAVGNSGRSPMPHLHMQVQGAAYLGAPTVPFRLANYLSATDPGEAPRHWNAAGIPSHGAIVSHAVPEPGVQALLASFTPGCAVWAIESKGRLPSVFSRARFASTVRAGIFLTEAGRHVLRVGRGGALIAGLDPDAWRVLDLQVGASPLQQMLALAVPSIPYAARPGLTWAEPAPIVPFRAARWLGLSFAPYLREPFAHVRCQCVTAPGAQSEALVVETLLETPCTWLPSKLVCEFERLRGPVRLEAIFDNGSLVYSLLSFEPGLPFEPADR